MRSYESGVAGSNLTGPGWFCPTADNFISEDQIERKLLQKLQHVHGCDVLDCNTDEREDLADGSGRASKRDVWLLDRLRTAAVALNPGIPETVIDAALEKLADRRLAMLP